MVIYYLTLQSKKTALGKPGKLVAVFFFRHGKQKNSVFSLKYLSCTCIVCKFVLM